MVLGSMIQPLETFSVVLDNMVQPLETLSYGPGQHNTATSDFLPFSKVLDSIKQPLENFSMVCYSMTQSLETFFMVLYSKYSL